MALVAPARFIFAHAVLQIEHREAVVGILIVIRGSENEAPAGGAAAFGKIVNLPQLAMGNVLESVKVLVLGRDFYPAAPAAAAIEIEGIGVRNLCSVNDELVIMESF